LETGRSGCSEAGCPEARRSRCREAGRPGRAEAGSTRGLEAGPVPGGGLETRIAGPAAQACRAGSAGVDRAASGLEPDRPAGSPQPVCIDGA